MKHKLRYAVLKVTVKAAFGKIDFSKLAPS